MKSRLIMFFLCIICLVFIVSLSRSIYSLWQKQGIVKERQTVQKELEAENTRLKEELNSVESPEFIERQAREKLNLQREGEVVVVLPKEPASPQPQSEAKASAPNWQQWLKLFF